MEQGRIPNDRGQQLADGLYFVVTFPAAPDLDEPVPSALVFLITGFSPRMPAKDKRFINGPLFSYLVNKASSAADVNSERLPLCW